MSFIKYFLLIYGLSFFLVCFVWRTAVVWKETGVLPLHFGRGDSLQDFIGGYFKICSLIIFTHIISFIFFEDFYNSISLFNNYKSLIVDYISILILIISFLICTIAQAQMKNSWKIGIDKSKNTKLIIHGFYKYSRNPIYLAIVLSAFGIFLLTPSYLSMMTFILVHLLLNIQIRQEEDYLKQNAGNDYKDYLIKVRRWI